MDRFVKNFIAMSMVYLALASVVGVMMLSRPAYLEFRFVHSHLMLLGWVSMMIYGVGYHILPKFAGRFIASRALGEAQFWLSNAGLVGMLLFYFLLQRDPGNGLYTALTASFGGMEAVSILLFFYNIMITVFGKEKPAKQG